MSIKFKFAALRFNQELLTEKDNSKAQSAGAVEYANCISAEWVRHPHSNKCLGYDTKLHLIEALVLEFSGIWSTSDKFIFIQINSSISNNSV